MDEVKAVRARDWPYFDTYANEVEACIRGNCTEVEKYIGQLNDSLASSLLGPHLLPSEIPQPFAPVPFCSYQNNLTILGQESSIMDAPLCSNLAFSVIAGRLCYKAEIMQEETKPGESNGLFFIIDAMAVTNHENIQPNYAPSQKHQIIGTNVQSDGMAEVYIPTLAPIRAKAHGTMALSFLKKVTASDGFLGRDESFRGCSLKIFEDCQTEELLKACDCLPWGFLPAIKKVMIPTLIMTPFPRKLGETFAAQLASPVSGSLQPRTLAARSLALASMLIFFKPMRCNFPTVPGFSKC